VDYVVRVSTSRAKRKRRQRARAAAAHPGHGDAAAGTGTGGKDAQGAGTGGKDAQGAGTRGKDAQGAGTGRKEAKGGAKGARAKGERAPARIDMRDGVARPEPIWAPFPLTEIGIAAGIIIFGAGFESNRPWLIAIASLVLAVVVGDLCLREHFAGFRSHAVLLAAIAVVAAHTVVALAITDAYRGPLTLVVDLALGGALAWWLRGRFRVARERARSTQQV
jgi:hypothetical protein